MAFAALIFSEGFGLKDIKDNEGWNYSFTNECCKVLSLEWTFNNLEKCSVKKCVKNTTSFKLIFCFGIRQASGSLFDTFTIRYSDPNMKFECSDQFRYIKHFISKRVFENELNGHFRPLCHERRLHLKGANFSSKIADVNKNCWYGGGGFKIAST